MAIILLVFVVAVLVALVLLVAYFNWHILEATDPTRVGRYGWTVLSISCFFLLPAVFWPWHLAAMPLVLMGLFFQILSAICMVKSWPSMYSKTGALALVTIWLVLAGNFL